MTERFPDGVQELEHYLDELTVQQTNSEKTGKYVDAENLRIRIQDGKKELERRKLQEMESRHYRDNQEMDKAHADELEQFNKYWDNKVKEYNDEAARCENELLTRHSQELDKTKEELEKTLPLKHKESSELLNLKKMEEHMAKQKNYVEAHKVQAKIAQLDKAESENWAQARSTKIQTALNQLRAKQANQLAALKKRIATGNDEQRKDRRVEEERLVQKYNNVKKELKAQQEKECLAFKGQFKSKASVSGSGSKSKN